MSGFFQRSIYSGLSPFIRSALTSYSTLYRAVSEAELSAILLTGRFNQGPNSVGGKYFAETLEDAKNWGRLLNGEGNFRIVAVKIPKKRADKFYTFPSLDGIGPARYAELDELADVMISVAM
jgi:hypothetical protein